MSRRLAFPLIFLKRLHLHSLNVSSGLTNVNWIRTISTCNGTPLFCADKTPDDSNDPVTVKVSDGVRRIVMNRPEKKNALSLEMFKGIVMGLRGANDDEDTVIVAITGTGDYYTSGMDLTPRPKPKGSDQERQEKPKEKGKGVLIFLSSFLECRKPVIALVNGPAFGVGVTMLGLCDAVYASDKATFHTKFSQYGVPPEMTSTYTFPRVMGYAKASNLLMFDQKIGAEEALKSGLVSRVFPHEKFHEQTQELLKEYGQLPVKSLMYCKDLVRGRNKSHFYKVSEHEQSYFDPVQARKVIAEWIAKQKKTENATT